MQTVVSEPAMLLRNASLPNDPNASRSQCFHKPAAESRGFDVTIFLVVFVTIWLMSVDPNTFPTFRIEKHMGKKGNTVHKSMQYNEKSH